MCDSMKSTALTFSIEHLQMKKFPSFLHSCVLSKISKQISLLQHSVIPLLPLTAQNIIDDYVLQLYPLLPSDAKRIVQRRNPGGTQQQAMNNKTQQLNKIIPEFSKWTLTHRNKDISEPNSTEQCHSIKNQVQCSPKANALRFCIKPKIAAVLIPLCHCYSIPSVLFTIRSLFVGTHQGQVSFPGGHVEDGESISNAALRETQEELGQTIGPIQILGQCTPILAITETLVFPILGYITQDVQDLSHLEPSPTEVDKVFCLSIDHLLNTSHRIESMEVRFGVDLSMPTFSGGPAPIWGLTALILDGILQKVLLPVMNQ